MRTLCIGRTADYRGLVKQVLAYLVEGDEEPYQLHFQGIHSRCIDFCYIQCGWKRSPALSGSACE